MIVIPAIDLKDGKCVRLRQGRMDCSTVFNDNPGAQARMWEDQGASLIHVVDLDGSIGGRPENLRAISEIVKSVRVPVELGGGIRSDESIEMYLELGISTVILGTIAARRSDLAEEWIRRFPGRVAIGIDARSGKVAVEGWTEATELTAVALARKLEASGPACFIYTDIERDGMMRGPNIPATAAFASEVTTPVILSGGVSSYDDVKAVVPLESQGVTGMIVGRALYDGSIDLKEAIRLAEKSDAC